MFEPVSLLALGKALLWFCDLTCSNAISNSQQRIIESLRLRRDSQQNHDLENAVYDAFRFTVDSIVSETESEADRAALKDIRQHGEQLLRPDGVTEQGRTLSLGPVRSIFGRQPPATDVENSQNQTYPLELLNALLFDDPPDGAWTTAWNPFRDGLKAPWVRDVFDRTIDSIEPRLRESFANILRTPTHRPGAIAYQQTMLKELLRNARETPEGLPAEAIATIEGLVAVPDLLERASTSVLDALTTHGERLESTAGDLRGLIERMRADIQGEFVLPDGELIHCHLMSNCEPVRQRYTGQPLVGRTRTLDDLTMLIQKHEYVAVTGPAGTGKSSLLSHWIERLRSDSAGPGVRVCHHFFSRKQGTSELGGGMACIAEQLLATHRIRGRISEAEPDRLKAALKMLLGMPHTQPLIVLLDGVDEIAGMSGSSRFALGAGWFPDRLGANVHVVFSLRLGPGLADVNDLKRRLQTGPIQDFPLGNLDIEAIRDLLADDRRDLASAILDKTGGVAIYAASVATALGQASPDVDGSMIVQALPEQFSDYVRHALREEVEGARHWLDPLRFLAVASGPLTTDELLRLCDFPDSRDPLSAEDLDPPPWGIARWLSPHNSETWSFQHESIASAYGERITRELRAIRSRLLADCANWRNHRGPYSLRRYSGDLWKSILEDGGTEHNTSLYALALDVDYRSTQQQAFPNEPALVSLTIQHAIRAAVARDDLALIVKLLFAHVEAMDALRQESPLAAARRGDLERGMWLASLGKPERATIDLLLIAWHEAEAGRIEHVERVRNHLERMPDFTFEEHSSEETSLWIIAFHASSLHAYPTLLAWLCQQLTTGKLTALTSFLTSNARFETALSVARAIKPLDERAKAVAGVAQALAEDDETDLADGTFDLALSIARERGALGRRADTLASVAVCLARAGHALRAIAIAGEIDGESAHGRIAQAIAIGNVELEQAVADLDRDHFTDDVLKSIGISLAESGHGDEATTIARLIGGRFDFARTVRLRAASDDPIAANVLQNHDYQSAGMALVAIARSCAGHGDIAAARSIANLIEHERFHRLALGDIAVALATCGATGAALATAHQTAGSPTHDFLLVQVVEALAANGEMEIARQVSLDIESPWQRVEALTCVAQALTASGAFEQARIILDLARGVTDTVGGTWKRVSLLTDIAIALHDGGEADAAQATLEFARGLANNAPEQESLDRVARGFAITGAHETALACAADIDNDQRSVDALICIAREMAMRGRTDEARATFDRADAAVRAGKLTRGRSTKTVTVDSARGSMAKSLSASGSSDKAYLLASDIASNKHRAAVMASLAETLAVAGRAEHARSVFSAAHEAASQAGYRQDRAYAEIASHLASSGLYDEARTTLDIARTGSGHSHDSAIGSDPVLYRMVEALLMVGEIETARKIADAMEDGPRKARALDRISKAPATTDSPGNALSVDQNTGHDPYAILAKRLASRNQLDEARNLIESIEDRWERLDAIAKVIQSLARLGSLELALEVSRMLEDDDERDEALGEIAQALASETMGTAARSLVGGITQPIYRHGTLARIARELAARGAIEDARAITNELGDSRRGNRRSSALEAITEALAARGAFEEALDAAVEIADDRLRARALAHVAVAEASSGNFDVARVITGSLGSGESSALALSGIVAAAYANDAREIADSLIAAAYSRESVEQVTVKIGQIHPERAVEIAAAIPT